MGYRRDQHRLRPRENRPGGFTIVELLITMAMIILLLSILTVAIASATRTSQSANTRALMNSIKQALARFKADVGYYPPVLGDANPNDVTPTNHDLRKLFDPRGEDLVRDTGDDILPVLINGAPSPVYAANVQDWYSVTSLAEFLIGYGGHEQDGYGEVPANPPIRDWDQEAPALGIRHPGRDGAWGATHNGDGTGGLDDRMRNGLIHGSESAPFAIDQGKVYGPYLELKDERLLASITVTPTGAILTHFPGEGAFDPNNPRVIVDYWGRPIRYYRKLYHPGSLESIYRVPLRNTPGAPPPDEPSLADVFVLRPFDIKPGAAVDGLPDLNIGGIPDPSTTYALRTAEVALFSSGPDRRFNKNMRYDGQEFNKDNIVELVP